MSANEFVVSDMNLGPLKEESFNARIVGNDDHPEIKEEARNEEDILLFTDAEMDELSNQNSTFHIVDDFAESEDSMSNNQNYNIQVLSDPDQLLEHEDLHKYPLMDMNGIGKMTIKNEDMLNNFIKYKVLDGKHTKVWQCGVCQLRECNRSSEINFHPGCDPCFTNNSKECIKTLTRDSTDDVDS